jgi:hypothetical protein
MNTYRKTSIVVGLLFILGTVAGILSVVLSTPILGNAQFLNNISTNETQFTFAALCILTMGLSLAMVPMLMFPLFKKHNEAIAIGYSVDSKSFSTEGR